MAKIFINEKKKQGHINPEIYGHFSEHLGLSLIHIYPIVSVAIFDKAV